MRFSRTMLVLLGLCASQVIAQQSAEEAAADSLDEDAAADNPFYFDREPERCISLSRLRQTKILDERSVLFRMRGSESYVNHLDRECRALRSARTVGTRTRERRLCDFDIIYAINTLGSRRLIADPVLGVPDGFPCPLGQFYPITREEADFLELDPSERQAVRDRVVLTPIEPEIVDDASAEEAQAEEDAAPEE